MSSDKSEQGWRWWLEHLAFPVVLASVTAVAAIVATQIQGRHDRQAELALKTDLVSRMSSSSTEAVFKAQDVANRTAAHSSPDPRTAHQAAFDESLRTWSVNSAEIRANLVTYFGGGASSCWRQFAEAVTNYIRLSADPSRQRTEAVKHLKDLRASEAKTGSFGCPLHPPDDLDDARWDVVTAGLSTSPGHTYDDIKPAKRKAFRDAYADLGQALLSQGADLSAAVAREHASGF